MRALPLDTDLSGLAALVRSWTVEVTGHDGEGRGSGVLWHPSGLVVTNAHVVARTSRQRIKLADGREAEGRLVARDDRRDVALVQTSLTGIPDIPLGNPAVMAPGALVLALGHPWGVQHAMSLGVVHGVSVDRRGAPRYIAADVRLAPGNSGGPLVDATGRLVGINAMIVGGLGVAIPINVVQRVVREAADAGSLPFPVALAA
jgi:serine protease Do